MVHIHNLDPPFLCNLFQAIHHGLIVLIQGRIDIEQHRASPDFLDFGNDILDGSEGHRTIESLRLPHLLPGNGAERFRHITVVGGQLADESIHMFGAPFREKIAVKTLHITLLFHIRQCGTGDCFLDTDCTVPFGQEISHGLSAGTGTIGHRGAKPVEELTFQCTARNILHIRSTVLFVITQKCDAQLLVNGFAFITHYRKQCRPCQRSIYLQGKGNIFYYGSVAHFRIDNQPRGIKGLALYIIHLGRFLSKNQLRYHRIRGKLGCLLG